MSQLGSKAFSLQLEWWAEDLGGFIFSSLFFTGPIGFQLIINSEGHSFLFHVQFSNNSSSSAALWALRDSNEILDDGNDNGSPGDLHHAGTEPSSLALPALAG